MRLSHVHLVVLAIAVFVYSHPAAGQSITSPSAQVAAAQQQPNIPGQSEIARAVKKYRVGVDGGVGLDPEIIIFGAHAAFGPLFTKTVYFRPGVELGFGELTTEFGVNLDVIFSPNQGQTGATWNPYFGIGPNFGLSHKALSEEGTTSSTTTTTSSTGTTTTATETQDRFDFSDTKFDTGLNFVVGARRANGLFMEMKATAYGITAIRLMVGFDF